MIVILHLLRFQNKRLMGINPLVDGMGGFQLVFCNRFEENRLITVKNLVAILGIQEGQFTDNLFFSGDHDGQC